MEQIADSHTHLSAAGARFDDTGIITDFGDSVAEAQAMAEAAVVVPLVDSGLISVSGADAVTFLNSQLTSDIAAVSRQRAQYSGYCTPKGRLLATMLAFIRDDSYWLLLSDELSQPVAQRLQRYVLRAKVTLRTSNDALALFGVTGPRAAAALAAALTAPGLQPFEIKRHEHADLIALPKDRYLIACDADHASAIWRTLSAHMRPAGSNWWQLQTIRSGIATITGATQEAFIPQMLALDTYDGVSFEKGCYPGQEIVARTRYLGDLKRRLYYGHCKQSLKPGDAIVEPGDGRTAGTVTNAAVNDQGGWEFLAVMQRDAVKAGLDLHTASGNLLSVVSPATDILSGGTA